MVPPKDEDVKNKGKSRADAPPPAGTNWIVTVLDTCHLRKTGDRMLEKGPQADTEMEASSLMLRQQQQRFQEYFGLKYEKVGDTDDTEQ